MKRSGLGKLIFGVLLVAVMLCALPFAALAANDFSVSGDTTGYTYTNGVLTFTKGGEYTISMPENAAATSNQIKIDATSIYNSSKHLKLTLSSVKMERNSGYNIEFTNANSNNKIQVELVIDGENTITNKDYTSYCLYQNKNSTSASIKVSGSGNLTISNPNRLNSSSNVGDIFHVDNFTLDSENVQLVLNNVSIYAKNKIEINKGSLKIDQKLKTASRELHCLSADGEFIMSGGTLTANTNGTNSACIYVSDANAAGAGIKISGGTLDLTSYAWSRGALTLNLSTQNEATKALLIEGGTTSIYCTYKIGGTGIYLMGKNVVYTMAGGRLFIDSRGTANANTGITNYNGRGEVNIVFKGGETEIISDVALSLINSVTFDENFIHKNYAGNSEEVTPDNNILNVNGNIRKDYLLVTPAYRITYNVPNDCTLPNGLPTVYSKHDSAITITGTPTRPAYSFTGWTGSNGTTPQTNVTIPAGSTGDKEYTANWDGQEYTVYFFSNFEPGTYKEQSFKYGEAQALEANSFTRQGYDFTGWNTKGQPSDSDPGTPYADKASLKIDSQLDSDTLSLWAQWRVRSHTISYAYSNPAPDGAPAVPARATANYGTSQNVAAAPTFAGYTFSGWSGKTKTNGSSVTVDASNAFTMPDDDVEFTGSWTANTYTVTLNTNGGTINSGNITGYTYGVGATLPTDVTQDTYSFQGWYDNEGLTGTAITAISATETGDKQYWAKWEINQYPIKFVNEDGAVLQSSPVNYGETPTYTGETPTKAPDAQYTYTFAGWSPEIAAVTNEATYTATFTSTKRSYTITWLNDDDTVIDTTTVEYGVVPAHDAPTKDADADFIYTFSNWTPDLVSVAGPATYKAQFTATPKTEYTIIWLNGDGTELDRAAYKEGAEEPTTDKVPTKAADADSTYTFSGWDDGTVEGNVKTYTPQFTAALPSEYTIVLTNDGNGSASADPTSGAEGTEVTLTATPNTGYQFKEWQVVSGGVTITENKFSIGKENVEIKAIFEQSTAGKLYYTVSGEGQDHLIGSGLDAAFVVKRSIEDETTFSRFTGIQVDGTDTGTGDYEKWEGSIVINLKSAYLDTLSVGSHILTVLFTDGSVDISFTVSEVVEPVIIPPTGFEDVAVPSKTFTFKKVWEGGSEKSIKFTLYKQDGTVYHHGFDKKVISKTEWQYNAWFSEAAACYVMEKPAEGYQIRYENVGIYAGITDRCCDGGTIVNYKVPRTGDNANPMLWLGCALASLTLLCVAVSAGKRRKAN